MFLKLKIAPKLRFLSLLISKFEEKIMLDQIFTDLYNELKFGYLKKKHPFRYFCLASANQNKINQRTVVLRKITESNELIIYTDARSQKIKEYAENKLASALFYHPKKLLQIQVQGKIQIITSGKEYQEHWQKIQGNSQNDFITQLPPGTPIKNSDEVSYKVEGHHFCLLKLKMNYVEYLQLKRPNHIRASFTLNEEKEWEGQFLNP